MTMTNEKHSEQNGEENTTTVEPNSNTDDGDIRTDDRGHTFRKRRLSLTALKQINEEVPQSPEAEVEDSLEYHQQQDTSVSQSSEIPIAVPQQEEVEEDKAHTFRKRRLSLTHNREDSEHSSHDPPHQKRRRRESDASVSSMSSTTNNHLQSRVVHSSELLAHNPPLSPSISLPRLYETSAPPQQQSALSLEDGHGSTPAPKWKKRHTRHMHDDERTLPFPRDIVGTFSCHGVEPIYDSDYKPDDDEDYEDESDDEQVGWGSSAKTTDNGEKECNVNNSSSPPSGAENAGDKPTTAAKINQDRGGVAFPYGNCPRTALFAAYDGHGQGGELVSQFALHEVQRRLEKHPHFSTDIGKAFVETFLAVDDALNHEALIEPRYAGTTACVALLRENQLVVSNVGDSRAVLARQRERKDGSDDASPWDVIDLSTDQNPDLPAEQSRIEQMGGFVSPPPEPGLSARVWLDVGCTQIGLAMSRSIGDHAVKQVGVIAEPVVTTHQVTEQDDFVIIATDGVWEFISSEQAVQLVSENLDRGATRACQALIEAAAARWHDEEGDYRDDITALVIRLQHLWKPSKKSEKQTIQRE